MRLDATALAKNVSMSMRKHARVHMQFFLKGPIGLKQSSFNLCHNLELIIEKTGLKMRLKVARAL